jgi:hypothetical protein
MIPRPCSPLRNLLLPTNGIVICFEGYHDPWPAPIHGIDHAKRLKRHGDRIASMPAARCSHPFNSARLLK